MSEAARDWHARSADDVARALAVDPGRGLATDEAAGRLEVAGPNVLEAPRPPSVWLALREAVTEPFVLLLAAAGIGAVLLGETRDGLLVVGGLIPIVGADVATTYRSERALAELRDAVAPVAHVLRDGAQQTIDAAALVPGDVLLLAPGDVMPADARALPAGSLLVDRSILTGESIPEPAGSAPDAPDATVADRHSMLYAGTSIVHGRGRALVVATGIRTELAAIATTLGADRRRRSPLQRELDRLVRILLVAASALVVVTVGLGVLRGQPMGANLLAGISAAIAAIPEEPPVLLAVILGLGALRLMRRGVLVRRLAAQETLGAVDLIITDKTGTLTRNALEVEQILRPDVGIDASEANGLLRDALAAEDDAWTGPSGRRGSFARALESALAERGVPALLDAADLLDATGVAEGRPYSCVRHRTVHGWRELALGAPEAVMAIDPGLRDESGAWAQLVREEASHGGRLLLLAGRAHDEPWSLRALLRFGDALRDEVPEAVAVATGAGIQTVMVTGDHLDTAISIADAVGLPEGDAVTGAELRALSDDAVATRLATLRIVARAEPDQKLRLVRIGQSHGRSVAVTGDGVNDAPALHAADVAVAMGSGTAVAREASDLVLGDDSFATLMEGLREGRRIVANVQKGLVFLVSTHVALLGFILIATIAGFGQPLLPVQILWLELFIDLSASVAFEREPEEPGAMARPPRAPGRPLLDTPILARIAVAGGFSALAALAILVLHPGPFEHARWTAFTTLVVTQIVRAYANRSLRMPLTRIRRNGFLAAICVLVIAVQAAIPFLPPVADAFRASPLEPMEWAVVAAVALAPAVLAEAVRTARRGVWVA
jgi:Ca2+-transporting ATPase